MVIIMFDYIKGTVISKSETHITIETGNIGYKITSSSSGMDAIGTIGSTAVVYIYMHVREDALELYGFASPEERSTFEMLISVSGVGPKAAVSILSSISAADFVLAVVTNDPKTITKAQGVGPKLAQRIILELKDKIKGRDLYAAASGDFSSPISTHSDAADALIALGYSPAQALNAVKAVGEGLSLEDTIKAALKSM